MQDQPRPRGTATTILAWAGLFLLLAIPVEVANRLAGGTEFDLRHLPGLAAAMLALAVLQSLRPTPLIRLLSVLGILAALVIRFLHAGLVHFSGGGYGQEFFIHLEAESFRLAWTEYRVGFFLLAIALTAIALAALRALRRTPRFSPAGIAAVLVPCLLVMAWARAAMPEWQLIRSAQHWLSPVEVPIDSDVLQAWQASGLVETELLPTRHMKAKAPAQPRNLILIYLESVGAGLAFHPVYPELMPFLRSQLETSASATRIHHSSFITIEGIVNSQCGTLFQFSRDSDSLLGYEGIAEELPCLGDVLARAGYRQTYLGGADLGFGGKGTFLSSHGYTKVLGRHELAGVDLHPRPGTWGVSDADLFGLALQELELLQDAGQPFNLTLLTIGTHLPGYFYEECRRYDGARDSFLDAVHCTDQLLANFIDALAQRGHLDNTLVAITADHHVFPNPRMIGLFGHEAVYDRRLPLILIGDGARDLRDLTGAGYDLAPTLLDLLEIETNARFAMGQSLFRQAPDRSYFVTRYDDIHRGLAVAGKGECGSDQGIPAPPLDRCRKRELLTLLGTINAAHSAPPLRIGCEGEAALAIAIPAAAGAPILLRAGDMDLSGRFIRAGRPVPADREGVFLLEADSDGEIVNRRFFNPDDDPPELPEDSSWLAIVRQPATQAIAHGWPFADSTTRSIVLGHGVQVVQEVGGGAGQDIQLTLDAGQCHALLEGEI